jgi:hypothetical protein
LVAPHGEYQASQWLDNTFTGQENTGTMPQAGSMSNPSQMETIRLICEQALQESRNKI